MKKEPSFSFFLIVFFCLFCLLVQKAETDLADFSFRFFRSVLEEKEAREIFGLEEEEYTEVFWQDDDSLFV